MKRATFAALVFVAATYAAQSWAAPETVVAKVNGQDITEAELKYAEREIGSELAGVPEENRRRVLVEYLIEAHLMADAAEKSDLAKGEEFEERMKYYRLRALRDAFFENKVRDAVPEADAKKRYDDYVKNIPPQEEVRARHILVKTEDEAKKVAKELSDGGDFGELAAKYSQDRGGQGGGDLGYFSRQQMVKPFEEAAFALEKGKISDPVQTEFGWHIIKVEDKRERQPPSFEDVKDQIKASLVQAKLQGAVQALRSDAKIEFVDPDLKKAVDAEAAAAATPEAKPDAGNSEGEKKE